MTLGNIPLEARVEGTRSKEHVLRARNFVHVPFRQVLVEGTRLVEYALHVRTFFPVRTPEHPTTTETTEVKVKQKKQINQQQQQQNDNIPGMHARDFAYVTLRQVLDEGTRLVEYARLACS